MPASTYEPLGSVTLTSAQSQVTLSNIPQTYTDLVVVASVKNDFTGSVSRSGRLRFNGDASAVYSETYLLGSGSAASSARETNETAAWWGEIITSASGINANSFSNVILNINNYSNASTFKTFLSRGNQQESFVTAGACLYRSTTPITSITFFPNTPGTSNFVAGTTFNLYGVGANTLKATGGDIIQTDGTYWYHAFTKSGSFAPASGTSLTCDVLVVGGGGGGGAQVGGGGGAGGVFYATSQSISTAQTVTIGAGGAGGVVSNSQGSNGANSTFGSLTAALGGGGGGSLLASPLTNGLSGGSGGGGGTTGSNNGTGGASTQTGTGGTGYGFAGGNGVHPSGGGGGGAGAVGANSATGATGGNGGAGLNTWGAWLTSTGLGVSGFIAGGGGGGSNGAVVASGGSGGGGNGGASTTTRPIAGFPNTGGGGGGTRDLPDNGEAGARGGSGLVIVRYAV